MIVGIIQTFLSLSIGLITSLTGLRRDTDKKLTRWGIAVVALSIAGTGLSAWKVWEDSQRERLSRYILTDSDIQVQLTAYIINETSSDLESRTPSAIEFGLILPNEGGWTGILEAIPGFVYSGPGRGPAIKQRVYFTKAMHRTDNVTFKYVWDLAGKKIMIRNPKYAFSDVQSGDHINSWKAEVTLRIQGKEFKAEDSSAYWLEFVLEGLDKKTLLARSAF